MFMNQMTLCTSYQQDIKQLQNEVNSAPKVERVKQLEEELQEAKEEAKKKIEEYRRY